MVYAKIAKINFLDKATLACLKSALIACLLAILWASFAYAEPTFTEKNIIKAGIGEAAGEGEEGLYAVYCAILNRGTLNGVYGFKSKLADTEPLWVKKMAKRAYQRALNTSLAERAKYGTHWENTKTFGVPYWAKSMIKTVKVGRHQFYKEKKK